LIKYNANPVFICGYPKSGTTLMLSLLDGHEDLVVIPQETKFFNKVLKQVNYENKIDYLLNESNIKMLKYGLQEGPSGMKDYSQFNFEIFKNKFYDYWNKSLKEDKNLLESLAIGISHTTKQNSFKAWVEKTPGSEFYLDTIKKWWPQSKAIFLVRDPRQNYCSHIQYQKRKQNPLNITIENFIKRWGMSVKKFEKYSRIFDNDALTIRYEDLISDTKTIMKKVAQFLGVEYKNILETPTRLGKQWKGNASDGKKREKVQVNKNNYHQHLSKNEILMIDVMLHKEIERYQYANNAQYSLSKKFYYNCLYFRMSRFSSK